MSTTKKVLQRVLLGTSDANIRFEDLCNLLMSLGFSKKIKASHHMFRKAGITEKINLQKDGNNAKAYQVRQVRDILLKYKMGGEF